MLDHGCLINHCVKCKAWLNYDSHRLLLQVSIMHLITRYDDENMETNKCLYFRGVPFSWFYKKNHFREMYEVSFSLASTLISII